LKAPITITSSNGITIDYDDRKISLDPDRAGKSDYTFISHAHIDHMKGVGSTGNILATKETALLAARRGVTINLAEQTPDDLKMIESGHILGSRGLLIGDDVYYTGDFALKSRSFMHGCQPVKCGTLIMESTFGKRNYVFPPVEETMRRVNELIADLFSRGIPVVLMGYTLGKAQILSDLFSSWDPIYLHKSIFEINQAYIDLGIKLRSDLQSFDEAAEKGHLERKPWILIAPTNGGSRQIMAGLKQKYGAVSVAFSGWSVEPRYKYMRGVDHAFTLSDHCDFNDLVEMVRQCDPHKIYTVHGFADEFAAHLRTLGYNARPLKSDQTFLSEYPSAD